MKSLALALAPIALATFSAGAVASVGPFAFSGSAAVQDDKAPASLADLEKRIKAERDDVEVEVIAQIADMETREAMEALLRAYDTFGSVYMRRAVVRRLSQFDEIEDAFQPALEKLVNVATEERARELRSAGIEALGRCREHGKTFLALIVDSPAADDIRERALELHVRMGGKDDYDWYRKIYKRTRQQAIAEASGDAADPKSKKKKKKPKKKKKGEEEPEAKKTPIIWPTLQLKATAMKALISELSDDELANALSSALGTPIGREALNELSRRGSDKAVEFAEAILKRTDFRGTIRAQAATVLMKAKGTDVVKDLIDIAKKQTTQAVLRTTIADLLSNLKDEKVDKQLIKLVGKGKGPQKAFAIRATKHILDEKFAKKVRKGLKDKDMDVALATIHAVAERKDREAVEDMEKLLKKTKEDAIRQALLSGLSKIYDGENEWVERLIAFGGDENVDLRNAALTEIMRLGRRNTVDLFKERLGHADWSTRLIALKGLEGQRDAGLLPAIVEQMKKESGRMAIEFGDALFRLTGESFGKNAAIWERWINDQKGSITIIDEKDLEKIVEESDEKRLKQVSDAEFFGIRIESHRVLFIIDVSGSMNEPVRMRYVDEPGESRMEVAKRELAKAIKALDDNALFNIAPFSGGVESWSDEGIATSKKATREDALEYVSRLGAGGGTNLYGSLEFGFQDLDVDTIFVLSDGEPSVGDIIDPQLIREAVLEMNSTRNVVINTIAIGSSLEILQWLAEDSGGAYVDIR